MNYNALSLWNRFKDRYTNCPEIGLSMDLSRMNFPDSYFDDMKPAMDRAFQAMAELENGAIANPDEKRMVGHYWLRAADLAPTADMKAEILETVAAVKHFTAKIHAGEIKGTGGAFKNVLLIGIGGSALGPQFVSQALGDPESDKMAFYFFDNTDPDGMDRVLRELGSDLGRTLSVVISKSGGTKETRNGMLEARNGYEKAGLDFAKHAVAVTGVGSELSKTAEAQGWIQQFPMWDWVGGRTSVMSAVGLLPAALQGIDIESFLNGAQECDALTRVADLATNPAAKLALTWYYATNGKGEKSMVVLPYKDRLELFSKYLQQLIMESLGKREDLDGNEVFQGISVYGNKGSTDQHAYIQQLRDGVLNFFVTFIEVLKDQSGAGIEVESGATSGDYLTGFFLGTRKALFESDRESITITVDEVTAKTVGALIALYERAVGFYASLVNVNAYHQPGVEAGKKAAGEVIVLQNQIVEFLGTKKGELFHVEQIADGVGSPESVETVFKLVEHLSSNPSRKIVKEPGADPFSAKYGVKG